MNDIIGTNLSRAHTAGTSVIEQAQRLPPGTQQAQVEDLPDSVRKSIAQARETVQEARNETRQSPNEQQVRSNTSNQSESTSRTERTERVERIPLEGEIVRVETPRTDTPKAEQAVRYQIRTDNGDVVVRIPNPNSQTVSTPPAQGTPVQIDIPFDFPLERPLAEVPPVLVRLQPQIQVTSPETLSVDLPDFQTAPQIQSNPAILNAIPIDADQVQSLLKESTIPVQTQELKALARTETVIQPAQSLSSALTQATFQNTAPLPQAIGTLFTPEPSQVILPKHIEAFLQKPELIVQNTLPDLPNSTKALTTKLKTTVFQTSVSQALTPAKSPLNVQTATLLTPALPREVTIHNANNFSVAFSNTDTAPVIDFSKAGQVQAIFIGETKDSHTIVRIDASSQPQTGFQSQYLQITNTEVSQFLQIFGEATQIQAGAQLTLTPVTAETSASQTHSLPQIPASVAALPIVAPILFQNQPWQVMNDIQNALSHSATQAAQAMSASAPSPANTAQMMPAALFFIAAMKGGDLSQWLGEKAVELLQKSGKSNLLSRLSGESSLLSRTSNDPVSEWRSYPLPFHSGNEFQTVMLHVKEDAHDDSLNQQKGKQARFIFDLALDRMGDVQLDGLFRTDKLDLVVRTEMPMSTDMHQKMRQLYSGALELAGVTGELNFQQKTQQWVNINYHEQTASAQG